MPRGCGGRIPTCKNLARCFFYWSELIGMERIISLDTEATGLDLHHGAAPYIVTTCDRVGLQKWWRWDVDPLTRIVDHVVSDLDEIQREIDEADTIVLHHAKFDAQMLAVTGVHLPLEKVKCTIMASHILASNHPNNLTARAIHHLGVNILPYEDRVRDVTKACRQSVKKNEWSRWGVDTRAWRLAEEGEPDMPSVNGGSKRDEEKPWKGDMWLMDAVAQALLNNGVDLDEAGFPERWLEVTREYANVDSAVTLQMWFTMEPELKRLDLWEIFLERMKLVREAFELEWNGVTASKRQTYKLINEYTEQVDLAQAECLAVADQYDFELVLPDGAAPNDCLREFFWGSVRSECPRCGLQVKHKEWMNGPTVEPVICKRCAKRKRNPVQVECVVERNPCLNLPIIIDDKTGSPSLNKNAIEHYAATLEPGPALHFVQNLFGMRSQQTAITYMRAYERFWLPILHGEDLEIAENLGAPEADWCRLHPSVNPVGTDHLRWASYNPNAQNISKKQSFNLRRCFGPAPGREWWSMDAKNLELRIPAYEAQETDLMWIFEHPDEPPYYGSYHLVVFDTLHPELFAKHGKACKDLFESTWYQWVKNGNFAVIYGAQRKKADQTYHVPGAYDRVRDRFPRIAALNERYKRDAERFGYVETIPDKFINPRRGYPILVSRSDDGRTLPTTPFNYHISGTAMQWTNRAMVKTGEQLRAWSNEHWRGFTTLQVHDELVFDVPRGTGDKPWLTNLPRMREIQRLMESCGEGIGVPTPVSIEWHGESYAVGMAL